MTDHGGPRVQPTRSSAVSRLHEFYLRVLDSGIPESMVSGDAEIQRRARIIVSFTLVLILLGFVTALFSHWALPLEAALLIDTTFAVGLFLTLLIPLSFRRTGSLGLGANLVLGGSFLVIVTVFSLQGGIRGPLLHWLGLLPMVAILMGARRSAWSWATVGAATLALFITAEVAGWSFPNYLDVSGLEDSMLFVQRVFDVGSWLAILIAIAFLYDGHLTDYTRRLATQNVELAREVAQRKSAEERTHFLAYHDELTELPNRRLFKEQLLRAIVRAQHLRCMVGVLLLDLDNFKNVNDSYGHNLGDVVLREVAERLQNCVRAVDSVSRGHVDDSEVVSRLGGDEFTILLAGVRTPSQAEIVARRILESLENAIVLDDHDQNEVILSASIGIALTSGDQADVDELLRGADLAMYRAKATGKNRFQFFDVTMNEDIARRSAIVTDLRRALDREEFTLHYQPIVRAETGSIAAVEALVRWRHPSGRLVPPGEFISIAEEIGLIVPLGEWILRQACRDYENWRACGAAPMRLAVNVSAVQLLKRGNLVSTVVDVLRECGMDASSLELEITENAIMADEEAASRSLGKLKSLGVGLALDDFGTGFSSLSYVKRFPVDSLKIDRSFVGEIDRDPEAQAIATAIIAMAHQLGLRVVAEGVETEAQELFLRDHSCDELQGYGLSYPVPAAEIPVLLEKESLRVETKDDSA